MSYASDQGYIPSSVSDLMSLVRSGVNSKFGTTYDDVSFQGTNFYKFFYALIQRLQENEIKTAEIVSRLQQYFVITNQKIVRPNTTFPGLVDYFTQRGFVVSIKKPIDADAGKLYLCALLDNAASDYATKKLQVNTILKECVVAGVVTQGTEVSSITLSNGQSFDFKFVLPTKTPIKLRLTLTTSTNNQSVILTEAQVRALLFANINARYRLGLSFEPQRYFSVTDAPWTSTVLLEYSTNGGSTWSSATANLAYDVLYTFAASDISVVFV